MVKLTKRQVKFLIRNEDRITIGDFARMFKCSSKEVYNIYDRITNTQEYRDYTRKRVIQISGRIRKSEKENEQMECTSKGRKDEKKVANRLPLIYINNDTYDSVSRGNIQVDDKT